MSEEIQTFTAAKVLDLYSRKKLSPVEVMKASFAQIERFQESLNPFIVIADEADLMKQAKESEARWAKGNPSGILDGLPVTIKDDTGVKGWPLREGSLSTPETPVTEDAPQPARLREAGAIFLGKTTMPEFGHKSATDSPVTGATRNPWNPSKTTGGSSGGAGIAAATGMGYMHLGSDGGGSIRIPAHYCGVYGIKPTTGLVPEWPPSPFSGMATSGPLTQHVEDSALMLDVISGADLRDWYSAPYQKHDFAKNLTKPVKHLRIAYAPTINGAPVDPEVAHFTAEAAKKLQAYGTVEEISFEIPKLIETWNSHWMMIAAWIYSKAPQGSHEKMDPYFRKWAARGDKLSLNEFGDAQVDRANIGMEMNRLMAKYDIIVLPAMAKTAYTVEQGQNAGTDDREEPFNNWIPFTFPANLTKQPAASLPCGVTKDGMPVGVQIMSGYLKDGLVLNVSHALEQEIGFKNWLERDMESGAGSLRKKAAG